MARPARQSVTEATLPGLPRFVVEQSSIGGSPAASGPTERTKEPYVQRRRGICFLQLLAHRTTMLARVLSLPPYSMPATLIQQVRLFISSLGCHCSPDECRSAHIPIPPFLDGS